MDFSELLQSSNNDNPIIQETIDPEKYTKILTTLCEKRKALEAALATPDLPTREEDTIALMQLKNDMALFNISEITYQAYLVKQEQTSSTPTSSTPTPVPESASTPLEVQTQATPSTEENEGF